MNNATTSLYSSEFPEIAIPEVGQLVNARRRQWVVSNVQESTIQTGISLRHQHLVSMVSVDEDSLGEELTVLWQLEPGAKVLDKAGLPKISGYDDPNDLQAFLDAVRWGAATNADRSFLQSPFRSGISIEPFQLDPVARAIDMARVNLLIADDVGLGKTIEAGLIIQELLLRHRARTSLILCPSSLQVKWQIEMQEKFGLEFRIVDSEYLKKLRREQGIHANPWTSFPRLITSMDWMKAGEGLRLMKDILPSHITYPRKFDILIVDEAHNIAPARAVNYSLESQRTRLIRTIGAHYEHRLFLSATPHNGYQESFTSLLELLDDQRFARNVMPDERQLQRIMIRRLKTDLVDSDGNNIYPRRIILPLEIEYSQEECEIHETLKEYAGINSRKNAWNSGKEFVHNLLKKRLFSSPQAFARTLEKYKTNLATQKREKKENSFDERILRKAILRVQEDYADDRELEEAIGEVVTEVASSSVEPSSEERNLLEKLSIWSEKKKNAKDSKATAIIDWIEKNLKTNGDWNEHRVILFTEYRATLDWLFEILVNHQLGGNRLSVLHGGIDADERQKITAAFQANPRVSEVRILLASDAASEGIDLQNYCNFLIHVEIPWNPNVMEQRNGRIDRQGQKESEVYIWHPVGQGFKGSNEKSNFQIGSLQGDHEYLMRAVQKVETIRQDLGCVGPVIADQIQEGMSGKRKQLDIRVAEEKAQKARKFLTVEKQLQTKIAKLHERLLEVKNDFGITPVQIANAVQVGLKLANRPPLTVFNHPDFELGQIYEVPMLSGSWGRATEGLNHPHTGKRRPITFDPELAKGRDDVVLAHLNHHLVQMCLRLLRAEVWAFDDRKSLHRVAVRLAQPNTIEHPVALVWSRLVITGGNHHLIHEELTLSGGELKNGGYNRITQISKLEEHLSQATFCTPSNEVFENLSSQFAKVEDSIVATVESRSRERLKYLQNTIERRRQGDIKNISTILEELEAAIKKELNDSKAIQMELWPINEKTQLNRDLDALRLRMERIPEEKVMEISSIEHRYSGLAYRTFPVATIFILPTLQPFMELGRTR